MASLSLVTDLPTFKDYNQSISELTSPSPWRPDPLKGCELRQLRFTILAQNCIHTITSKATKPEESDCYIQTASNC